MSLKRYMTLGIMSGTSCDGLDMAFCEFWIDKKGWNYKLKKTITIPYSRKWKNKLLNCNKIDSYKLEKLDLDFGNFIAKSITNFINKSKIKPILISSHGHTVFHNPKDKISVQIGNGQLIFSKVKIPVVYNFRQLDILMGGQGAPLVPFGEKFLFTNYDYCINIGGILNITDLIKNKIIAYDVCAANLVLNYLSRKIKLEYDKNGIKASKGKLIEKLFNELNTLKYYKKKNPKSLDVIFVEKKIIPLLLQYKVEDMLFTYTEHIAYQLNNSLKKENAKILLTGGGTFNKYLVKRIKYLDNLNCNFFVPEKKLINFKESLIFGFLGLFKFLNKKNVLKSVTGAKISTSSGILIK
tara:strand:+ start:16393 stop:17451 length:1059 start_codon:yes stop_codon:yes gene_type:complete